VILLFFAEDLWDDEGKVPVHIPLKVCIKPDVVVHTYRPSTERLRQ
jgi:hypothetical protein